MNLYESKVFPSINDFLTKDFQDYRVELLKDATGDVLEVGMGSGMMFGLYPSSVKNVCAIDPNSGMLAKARAKDCNNIKILHGRAEQLSFEDNYFDTVVCFLVLCSVSDLDKSLKEIRRVLKKDGKLLFFEHIAHEKGTLRRGVSNLLNPLWKIGTCGCHLNRDTVVAMQNNGFLVDLIPFVKPISNLLPFARGVGQII